MRNDWYKVFLLEINDMRFTTVDDLFIKKVHIKERIAELDKEYLELYKWYFFYQLCMLKEPLKTLMWDFVCGYDNIVDLTNEYRLFCEKRNKIMAEEALM